MGRISTVALTPKEKVPMKSVYNGLWLLSIASGKRRFSNMFFFPFNNASTATTNWIIFQLHCVGEPEEVSENDISKHVQPKLYLAWRDTAEERENGQEKRESLLFFLFFIS